MESPNELSTPNVPDATLAGRDAWRKKQAILAEQTVQARRGLVEREARRRAFEHLQEEIGTAPEDYPAILDDVTESYLDGTFFLRQMGLFYEVSPALSLAAYSLRQEWIRQYSLTTVPELMLLDQAMLAYFHVIRLNRQVASMMALTEQQLLGGESPLVKIKAEHKLNNEFDGFVAEDAIQRLQERLMPLMERFNVMFLRNLRAMRELKGFAVNVNIGQAGQVNVGQQQVNVAGGAGRQG